MSANLLGWILGVGACEGQSEEAQRTRQIFLSPPRRADPRQRGSDEPGETTATPRLEADPGDLHVARCLGDLPDSRRTACRSHGADNPR